MTVLSIIGMTVIVLLLILLEWSKLSSRKERFIYVVLIVLGYSMAVLLIMFPDLPGPTQVVEVIYKPFSNILKKD